MRFFLTAAGGEEGGEAIIGIYYVRKENISNKRGESLSQ